MNRHSHLLVFSLVFSVFSGCAVYKTARPELSGIVRAKTTNTPVAEAQVSIEGEKKTYLTDSRGSFMIPAHKKWFFIPMIFPVDYVPGPVKLTVSKNGYAPARKTLSWQAAKEKLLIELLPAARVTLAEDWFVIGTTVKAVLPRSERKKIPSRVTMRQLVELLGPGWHPDYISSTNVMWLFNDGVRISAIYPGNLDKPLVLRETKQSEP